MTNPLLSSSLLTPLFSSVAMQAVVEDRARLQRMLDFEAALARAEAALGVIPATAAAAIASACQADRYDIAAIGQAAVAAGNIAIPLIKALTAEVAKSDAEAARYVHWGATSQDVIDTALVLELRAAIDALTADLDRAINAFTTLTGRNRRLPTVARTWLQHALPMPFGLKLAGYAAALARSRDRLKRLRKEALMLQFGGAAGTLAALGDRGLDVTEKLAALLDLPAPEAPWHSHRD
ncbi:MAG: 3-carboxy-cis,cis-muconate cycloisomerase, partial [Alphaproteobacteria bacterium]|nr:3-carboxy-cis,cis-muconate cycloisomerase [Alphaproteobacteria bacterium]